MICFFTCGLAIYVKKYEDFASGEQNRVLVNVLCSPSGKYSSIFLVRMVTWDQNFTTLKNRILENPDPNRSIVMSEDSKLPNFISQNFKIIVNINFGEQNRESEFYWSPSPPAPPPKKKQKLRSNPNRNRTFSNFKLNDRMSTPL